MARVGEQLHHGEDIVKTNSHMAGTEVPSQSSLVHKEVLHLDKDCQGISIIIDSRDLCPGSATADQELEEFQPSVKEAIQNVMCNDMKKSGGHQPQSSDLPPNFAGIIGHLSFDVQMINLMRCYEVVNDDKYFS